MQTVKCIDCGRRNRLPHGYLVEAHCGRCESALTMWTWVMAALRSRTLWRGMQLAGAVILLSAVFAGDFLAWLETEPFRLNETPRAEAVKTIEDVSLAGNF